jgi:hypothetical protein
MGKGARAPNVSAGSSKTVALAALGAAASTAASKAERASTGSEPYELSKMAAYGATLSLPRLPGKVPSPSDLPTFAIVRCQPWFVEFRPTPWQAA